MECCGLQTNDCRLAIATALVLGCASGGAPPSGETPGPLARAGDTQTGIEVRTAPDAVVPSGILEAPADTVWALLSDAILTTVRADGPTRSRLETEVSGEATAMDGTSSQAVVCVTNGQLELRLHGLVAESVRGKAAGR